jgi:hypothetical protein
MRNLPAGRNHRGKLCETFPQTGIIAANGAKSSRRSESSRQTVRNLPADRNHHGERCETFPQTGIITANGAKPSRRSESSRQTVRNLPAGRNRRGKRCETFPQFGIITANCAKPSRRPESSRQTVRNLPADRNHHGKRCETFPQTGIIRDRMVAVAARDDEPTEKEQSPIKAPQRQVQIRVGCLKRFISSLVVFISEEQTKETDENVGSLFLSGLQNFVIGNEVWTLFVIAELLSETQGAVLKGLSRRHCEEEQ